MNVKEWDRTGDVTVSLSSEMMKNMFKSFI